MVSVDAAAPPSPPAPAPRLRPRDAASLILIDRSQPAWRVLLGCRSARHAFMPETFVFPGGRRDPGDHALPFVSDLHPLVTEKLSAAVRPGFRPASARALAQAAVRELGEETGLLIGRPAQMRGAARLVADLAPLRFVARAITPPGFVRRFDTRFFAAFVDEVGLDPQAIRDSNELSRLGWHAPEETADLPMPEITRIILAELADLMNKESALPFGTAVPFFYTRHGRFMRSHL